MSERMDELDARMERLQESFATASATAGGLDQELRRMRETLSATGQDVKTLEKGLSSGLRKAFDGIMFDGMKLSDALGTVAKSMMNTTYNAAVTPVTNHFGNLISQGVGGLMNGVMPFAKGGVVSGPMAFPMRGGVGVMGEAGPEAIMPLARGPDGKLGVRGGGQNVNVVMNISTPDVAGFQRSQSQIAAQMSRAIGLGQRNR